MNRISARIFALLVGVLICLLSAPTFAQAPTPAPELQKLDFLTGTWTDVGDMKPGPMGPGGKMTMTENNAWMQGNFFLVLHSKFDSATMGSGSGTAFMGYDPGAKQYTYDEFNSMGEATHSTGTLDGDTWTWLGDAKVGPGQTMKGRFTMKVLSPTSYTFKYEMSPDGSAWTTVMDGKSTKSK